MFSDSIAFSIVGAPGLPVEEVERHLATPLEKLLYQINGVEHVDSISQQGAAVVTAQFNVGEDREESLVKIYNKIYSNIDLVPPYVASWVVNASQDGRQPCHRNASSWDKGEVAGCAR